MGAIIDVKFIDANTETWNPEEIDNILDWWEKINRYKQGKNFYELQKHFSMFVLSVDGIMGKEAKFLLATLSWIMAAKTDEPIL